jgi:hypothetical protein
MGQADQIIITACHDDVIREIGHSPRCTVLKVPNKGKDIGGKMAAIAYYLKLCPKTDYFAFLHDKISPQTINAGYWLDKLYSIFKEPEFKESMRILEKGTRTGIIGNKTFLKNEYMPSAKKFNSTNDNLLRQLIDRYSLRCRSYDFIAGTIFTGRSQIWESFFSSHSIWESREKLESGNVLDLVDGTYTHCWERLFCFIANHQGYEVRGIQ